MTPIPEGVHQLLRQASEAGPNREFKCAAFPDHWNQFVSDWAPRIHAFVEDALGPYGTQPKSEILPLSEGFHMACANASFDLISGQIRLGTHLVDQPGATLEKLTHEMIHGSLALFPNDDDGYYTEGYVDYSTWILAHAPIWEPYRQEMIQAAADNIRNRRERALKTGNDYDRKRWSGGLFAMTAYGPYIIAMLRQRKAERNFTW
jgi:hypothetical protein